MVYFPLFTYILVELFVGYDGCKYTTLADDAMGLGMKQSIR